MISGNIRRAKTTGKSNKRLIDLGIVRSAYRKIERTDTGRKRCGNRAQPHICERKHSAEINIQLYGGRAVPHSGCARRKGKVSLSGERQTAPKKQNNAVLPAQTINSGFAAVPLLG